MPTGNVEAREVNKVSDGPGGWKCPCCNPGISKAKTRRMVRRVIKHKTTKLVKEETETHAQ